MTVVLNDQAGNPLSTFSGGNSQFSQGNPANPGSFAQSRSFGDIAAEDRSAPGLLSPKVFGQTTEVNAAEHTIGQAGSTGSFGFGDLRDTKAPRSPRRSGMGGGRIAGRTSAQLNPDQEIGLKPAAPGTAEEKAGPTEQEQAESEIAQENIRQGHAPGYTIGGNMTGRGANFGYGQDEGTANGGMGSSYTNGGTTSDAEAADINARAGI